MSHPDDGVLQELLDGELAPADAAAVRAHLAACAACQTALAELKAVQDEADSLIERLPLDPPLQLPSATSTPARRLNARLLGLAASAVLVVGTSWVLFRTPSLMRDRMGEVTPPATATIETPPTAPMASGAAPQEAPSDAAALDGRLTPRLEPMAKMAAPPAAPPPTASAAAPAQEMRPARQAFESGRSHELAGATAKQEADANITERMLTIDGLRPDSVEVLRGRGDSPVQIRQVYMLGQVPVTLLQVRVLPELAGDSVPVKAREQKKGYAAEPAAAARAKADVVSDSTVTVQGWAGNVMFELSGNLSADSLAALKRRVR